MGGVLFRLVTLNGVRLEYDGQHSVRRGKGYLAGSG